jgi:hypothetical protein
VFDEDKPVVDKQTVPLEVCARKGIKPLILRFNDLI